MDGVQNYSVHVSLPFPKGLCALSFIVVDFIFLVYELLREAGGYQLFEFRIPLIKDKWKIFKP